MFGDTPLRRRSNSTSRSSKQVPGSELPFSLGPQPTFRLLGPVKSSPKMPHPDSGERPLSVFWQLPEVPSLLRDFPQVQHTGGSNELVDKGRGALVRGGNVTTAEKLVDALNQEFPLDTLMQNYWLPVSYTHLRAHETRHDLVCR